MTERGKVCKILNLAPGRENVVNKQQLLYYSCWFGDGEGRIHYIHFRLIEKFYLKILYNRGRPSGLVG